MNLVVVPPSCPAAVVGGCGVVVVAVAVVLLSPLGMRWGFWKMGVGFGTGF